MKTLEELKDSTFCFGWEMFSDEGDRLVEQMIDKLLSDPSNYSSGRAVVDFLNKEADIIDNKGHGEVFDTEVRNNIADAVEATTGIAISSFWNMGVVIDE